MPPPIILSVGGSLVVPPEGIDTKFLHDFKKVILSRLKVGQKFVIVVGGGRTARSYQEAAKKLGSLTRDDLDWLGIHATRLNGHLMRTIFRSVAHPIMYTDPHAVPVTWKEKVVVAAGWRPGWSTDYDTTLIAKRLKAPTVINLSNTDGLYDRDPRKHPDAKRIPLIGWKEFRAMFGSKWDPGMSAPFDPVASKLAQQAGMKVVLVNGKKMGNLKKVLEGKEFVGTVIE